eukprot:CAMPEP_0115312904 /NCGR_PEP_ID=MMETSP0270-20121206/76166_1 /TAXON_ID=71861 /ORGANISM="Scrippsiella trochoidea, Strain CCMP3099" /LENGTH=103 /DNA_ID=CAMNT_0002731931 /DNA_START=106 /DNA_END=417 /DNA_ORIENTATION=-
MRINEYTGRYEEFDPRMKIFFSPTIAYCNYGDVYMKSARLNGKWYRFALQLRVQPGTYSIGQETVGARSQIDPYMSNSEIEWYTSELHTHVVTGVLIQKISDM